MSSDYSYPNSTSEGFFPNSSSTPTACFTSASVTGLSATSYNHTHAVDSPNSSSSSSNTSSLNHDIPVLENNSSLNNSRFSTFRSLKFRFPSRLRRYTSRRGHSTQQQHYSHRNQKKKRQSRAKRALLRLCSVPVLTSVIIWSVIRRRQDHSTSKIQDGSRQERIGKPAQPWKVAAYSTLPLKAISRLWGRCNDIDLPVWMRAPTYRAYSYLFGVNLDEVANNDLTTYPNLGEFFYRELKPGVRPIDESAPLVSPADGTVLHLGVIRDGQVEQVKGITYSLEALLGSASTVKYAAPSHSVDFDDSLKLTNSHEEVLERHKEFAELNGISYTLDDLIGSDSPSASSGTETVEEGDASVSSASSFATKTVAQSIYSTPFSSSTALYKQNNADDNEKELFFCVIYLAPGDYHRFHSPANWVSELRRHFVGELYSVAPYFQKRLSNLFVLNERVALLGRWKHGFFSMTPVGATNVGSIRVHFDKGLATNTVYENEPHLSSSASSMHSVDSTKSADSFEPISPDLNQLKEQQQKKKKTRVQKSTCYEATYAKASSLLNGYPLLKGQQMGGFNLGSTVVLVFEAPKKFHFSVEKGEKVKVGQALGEL